MTSSSPDWIDALPTDRMIGEARSKADSMVGEARTQAATVERDARNKATSLVQDAERRHNEIIGGLEQRKGTLENEIEKLRTFEREYRTRLKDWAQSIGRGLEAELTFILTRQRIEQGAAACAVLDNGRMLVSAAALVRAAFAHQSHIAQLDVYTLPHYADRAGALCASALARRDALGVKARLVPVPGWLIERAAAALGRRAVARRLLGNLQADISKSRRLLGWSPPVSTDEGLRRAAADFRMGMRRP